MGAVVKLIRTEPARVVAVVLALIGLLGAFGLSLSADQSAAIVALVGAVLALVGGETVRARVVPTAKVRDVLPGVRDAGGPRATGRE